MTNDIERAKAVLAENSTMPFGIFGVVAGSKRFPPRELLNEFLMGGSDPCDQDQRMVPWPPFMLSADEFAAVEAWWQSVHPGSVTDWVVMDSWHDWTAQLIESIDVNDDVRRINVIGRRIADELRHYFSHSEQEA